MWDGRSLEGRRVLVRCYHGLGDTLQFIRYMPLLKARARQVIVWAQPPLLPLVSHAEGVDEALPLHDAAPDVQYDVDIEIMELPFAFRTTLATIPADGPYLSVEGPERRRSQELRVGLAWRAGDWHAARSVPVDLFGPLANLPGVRCFALHEGARRDETVRGVEWPTGRSISEVAILMSTLDLVISVDTMAAHLAGALGVPTWLLLHAHADWRWMIGRTDTPWYPRTTLYRQHSPGDWRPVVARVGRDLQARLCPHQDRSPTRGVTCVTCC